MTFEENTTRLEEILKNNPDNIDALKNLGLCEVNLDNPIDAIKAFKKLTEICPSDATSFFYLANSYNRTGQKEFAILNFKKVIELRPNYKEAYTALAMIYIEFGQYEEASNLAKSAIENPEIDTDYSFYYILATIAMINKHTIEAINNLELAHRMNPEHIQIANSLAVSYMNLGKFSKVLPVLNKIYKFDKDNFFYQI